VAALFFLAHHITMGLLLQRLPDFAGCWKMLWTFCAIAVLLLGQQAAAADKTAADYFIDYLPGQPKGPLLKMHAG
jgi:carboxypeptidase D